MDIEKIAESVANHITKGVMLMMASHQWRKCYRQVLLQQLGTQTMAMDAAITGATKAANAENERSVELAAQASIKMAAIARDLAEVKKSLDSEAHKSDRRLDALAKKLGINLPS